MGRSPQTGGSHVPVNGLSARTAPCVQTSGTSANSGRIGHVGPGVGHIDRIPDSGGGNAQGSGPTRVSGTLTYTNAFFTEGVAQPLIILEDQSGFVTRDRNFVIRRVAGHRPAHVRLLHIAVQLQPDAAGGATRHAPRRRPRQRPRHRRDDLRRRLLDEHLGRPVPRAPRPRRRRLVMRVRVDDGER